MAYFHEDYIGTPAAKPSAHDFINAVAEVPFRRNRPVLRFGGNGLL
jgi:hypothetical protein